MFSVSCVRGFAAAAFVIVCQSSGALAASGGVINLQAENDFFADAGDRHYSNGIRISWLTPPNTRPERLIDTARRLPFFSPGTNLRFSVGGGQNIYTPEDINLRNPARNDRPYAGWLYGSVGLVSEADACAGGESENCLLENLELDFGIVGPAAMGRQVQRGWHSMFNIDKPEGWSHQLKNEPGVVLYYERKHRAKVRDLASFLQFDFTPHYGGALGNVFTYGAAGATVRLGDGLPRDYGPPRIRPSLPGSGFFEPNYGQENGTIAWYVFAGAEARAVARNIFLDGNTFANSRSVDRKVAVGDLLGGLVLTVSQVRMAFTYVMRSKEFDGQDKPDQFGAVSLSYAY